MTVHCREEIYTEGGKRGGSGGLDLSGSSIQCLSHLVQDYFP